MTTNVRVRAADPLGAEEARCSWARTGGADCVEATVVSGLGAARLSACETGAEVFVGDGGGVVDPW